MHISSRTFSIALSTFLLGTVLFNMMISPATLVLAQSSTGEIFGDVMTPPGVDKFQESEGAGDIGLVFFISRVIQIGTIVAGLWVVANILMTSFTLFSSKGDAAAMTKVKDVISMSGVGLLLITTAYTIAGILGLLLFNDPTYIINPKISGPTTM